MKAYVSIGYKNRTIIDHIVRTIKETLNEFEIECLVFVDSYKFSAQEERQMMDLAFTEIDSSNIIIVEGSEKAIGIGIETGYAKARNKTIFYLRNTNSEHSTTVAGTSDFIIVYSDIIDLRNKLSKMLELISCKEETE